MSRTITFKELVKLIHPDHNPHITDAGGKMRNAVLFKDKPEELYKLGIRWGVVLGAPSKPKTSIKPAPRTSGWDTGRPGRVPQPLRPRPPRYEWRAFLNETPRINDHVVITTLESIRVLVVRTTPKRVYFYHNGRRTFASTKNVYVVREVRVN